MPTRPRAAQQARLSGSVSVGLAPTTASVLGLPLMQAVRERYPDVRLHIVESLSGHLSSMLNARQLDLAVLFDTDPGRRWSVTPLVEEKLFLIRARAEGRPLPAKIRLAQLAELPLILPRRPHGLRATLDAAFSGGRLRPAGAIEIDSLAMLMDAVRAGLGCTIQPGAALARFPDARRPRSRRDHGRPRAPPQFPVQPVGRRAFARRAGRAGGAGGLRPRAGGNGQWAGRALEPSRIVIPA